MSYTMGCTRAAKMLSSDDVRGNNNVNEEIERNISGKGRHGQENAVAS